MKVVISDYSWPSINIEKEFFKKNNIELVVANSSDDLIDKIKDADGLLLLGPFGNLIASVVPICNDT